MNAALQLVLLERVFRYADDADQPWLTPAKQRAHDKRLRKMYRELKQADPSGARKLRRLDDEQLDQLEIDIRASILRRLDRLRDTTDNERAKQAHHDAIRRRNESLALSRAPLPRYRARVLAKAEA